LSPVHPAGINRHKANAPIHLILTILTAKVLKISETYKTISIKMSNSKSVGFQRTAYRLWTKTDKDGPSMKARLRSASALEAKITDRKFLEVI
jgi:hypothetical protein